jgi:hypothetical protein
MRALIDADVLLDIALQREPFAQDSGRVLDWAEAEPRQAAVAWHSLSNIFYLTGSSARGFLADLLQFVEVAPVGTPEARQALGFPMRDLEDAMLAAAALAFGASFVVTRNTRDFTGSPVPAISPTRFVQLLRR